MRNHEQNKDLNRWIDQEIRKNIENLQAENLKVLEEEQEARRCTRR